MVRCTDSSSHHKAELLVQICSCYVDLDRETGGVANIVRKICLHASDMGRKILLLCGNRELGHVRAIPGTRVFNDHLNVEVFQQGPHPMMGPTRQLSERLASFDQRCLVHVHTCFSAFTERAMAVLAKNRVPFIFTPHGKLGAHMMARHYWPKRLWWMLRARRSIQKASAIGLSSSREALQLEALGLAPSYRIVPNGYEPPSVNGASRIIQSVPRPFILFLGYLDPRKQPEFLVDAYARSRARLSHYLVFVGPDSYSHKTVIESRVRRHALSDRVLFYGATHGQDKWDLLNEAACLCLPSKGEGLPVVLSEALGAGLPSIFSEASNFPEVADVGAGIMLEGFETAQWAEAIDRVCLDRGTSERMRKAAEGMRPSYAWPAVVKRWCDVYDDVYSRQNH